MENPSLSLKDTGRIYLDHNATTPPLLSLVEHLPEWSKSWGNPSSIHWSGRSPKNLMREARNQCAAMIGAHPLEIIFTSGGSEANTTVIRGVFEGLKGTDRNEYIISSVEHPSLRNAARFIEKRGAIVHVVPVAKTGELDLSYLKEKLSERTALVSVMYANNETGHLFPLDEIVASAHAIGALVHSDAVQALGKCALNVHQLGLDFATFSAHKMYSLKGCGLLFAKKGTKFESLILGGGQERGRRAGTENTLAIAAFGHAANLRDVILSRATDIEVLRNQMEEEILAQLPGVTVTAGHRPRIPNTSSLTIDGIDGESLLMALDLAGVSVSTGAACSSGSPEPSPVLLAMGFTRAEAQTSLRLSLGIDTTREEIQRFVEILIQIVLRLRSLRPEAFEVQL